MRASYQRLVPFQRISNSIFFCNTLDCLFKILFTRYFQLITSSKIYFIFSSGFTCFFFFKSTFDIYLVYLIPLSLHTQTRILFTVWIRQRGSKIQSVWTSKKVRQVKNVREREKEKQWQRESKTEGKRDRDGDRGTGSYWLSGNISVTDIFSKNI